MVDHTGKIAAFNRRFAEMWRLPDEVLGSGDDDQAIAFVLDQLADPYAFLTKVRELYSRPDDESQDVLEFKDGRVFERFSQARRIGEQSVGRVWSFRDVTERRRPGGAARLQVMRRSAPGGGLATRCATLSSRSRPLSKPSPPASMTRRCSRPAHPARADLRLTELRSELGRYGKPLGRELCEGSLHAVLRDAVADLTPCSPSSGTCG